MLQREKNNVLLCPPLRTAPSIGEAAKLTDDVTEITSYTHNPPNNTLISPYGDPKVPLPSWVRLKRDPDFPFSRRLPFVLHLRIELVGLGGGMVNVVVGGKKRKM
jgi:hypothetical protein